MGILTWASLLVLAACLGWRFAPRRPAVGIAGGLLLGAITLLGAAQAGAVLAVAVTGPHGVSITVGSLLVALALLGPPAPHGQAARDGLRRWDPWTGSGAQHALAGVGLAMLAAGSTGFLADGPGSMAPAAWVVSTIMIASLAVVGAYEIARAIRLATSGRATRRRAGLVTAILGSAAGRGTPVDPAAIRTLLGEIAEFVIGYPADTIAAGPGTLVVPPGWVALDAQRPEIRALVSRDLLRPPLSSSWRVVLHALGPGGVSGPGQILIATGDQHTAERERDAIASLANLDLDPSWTILRGTVAGGPLPMDRFVMVCPDHPVDDVIYERVIRGVWVGVGPRGAVVISAMIPAWTEPDIAMLQALFGDKRDRPEGPG